MGCDLGSEETPRDLYHLLFVDFRAEPARALDLLGCEFNDRYVLLCECGHRGTYGFACADATGDIFVVIDALDGGEVDRW